MKVEVLNNGLRVVLVPIDGLRSVTVEVGVKIGAKYEDQEEWGLSHFLEHMAFKGTTKRPNPEAVFNEIDTLGASGNAETDLDMTSYYITTVNSNLEWAVEILADIMFDPQLNEKELEKEKGVIIEEIKMYEDNPMMGMSGKYYEKVWKPSNRGCWSVSAGVDDIRLVTREKLINFRNKYQDPTRMVLVISGNIGKLDKLHKWLDKYWGNYKNEESTDLPVVTINWSLPGSQVIHRNGLEQGHFCVGVPGITKLSQDRYALRLLEVVLSGNTSSKLFSEIRTKRGWAYYVYSISQSMIEGGLIGIQSGVRLDKLGEAIDLATEVMTKCYQQITPEEIVRSKSYVVGKIELALDRSEFWSSYVGEKVLLENKLPIIDEEIRKYREVEVEDIIRVAKKYFIDEEIRSLIISR